MNTEIVDLSDGISGTSRHVMLSRWAIADQEVLIWGSVPPEAIIWAWRS